ncbi:MAG: helix-turn-helix domain-containing protein [Phycisphaerales bacterium]|nr:helix-turn-helix domain-containing protein [Phycisphaerales bacterium]
MKSHEVLKLAAEGVGVKALAAELKLSPALVYKWCQESSRDEIDASGAINPLDRLAEIVRITENKAVVSWLCHEAGGYFVSNPTPATKPARQELLAETQKLVHEFSQLLTTVTRSIENDGYIDGREADRIRASWEHLKSTAEAFSVASEQGLYGKPETGL